MKKSIVYCVIISIFLSLNIFCMNIYASDNALNVGDTIILGKYFTEEISSYDDKNSEMIFCDNIEWGTERLFSLLKGNDGLILRVDHRPGPAYYSMAPLKWKIIDIDDGKATLMCTDMTCDNIFKSPVKMDENGAYSLEYSAGEWNSSGIVRSFLNGYDERYNNMAVDYSEYGFLPIAFSEGEKEKLIGKDIASTDGGIITDKVFLLSPDDMETMLKNNIVLSDTEDEYLLRNDTDDNVMTFDSSFTVHKYMSPDFRNVNIAPVICVRLSDIQDTEEYTVSEKPSKWAEESIENAVATGIVPDEIQSDYTKNITRKEFCRLAVETYTAKSGHTYSTDINDAGFADCNDNYVKIAYMLGIVSGVGNNMFAPDKNITRQEAAVMLYNLAKLLNIKGTERTVQFTDEGYFAVWARTAIYSVAAMKSGDTYVMAGTSEGRFSPYDYYTREQAIATMYRLYNCEAAPSETASVDGADTKLILSYHVGPAREPDVSQYYDVIIDKNGNIVADYPVIEDIGCGVYIYKIFDLSNNYGLLTGLLDNKGKVVVEAQYEDITTWAYNDTVTFKKGDTYYVYDTEGNLKGSIDYKLPDFQGAAFPYCVDSISGTNVVVRRWEDRYAMHGADPDMDWYIYRLFSKEKAADGYFHIRITDNGEFIANDLTDNKACVIDANGRLKLKTDFCTMYRVDKGLYFARSEFDKFQGLYKYFPEESAGDKVTFLNGDFQVIEEGLDNVEYEVDTENRVVKAYKNNEPFEFEY